MPGKFAGSYNVPFDKREELHKLIVKTVFEQNTPVNLTEKSLEVKPITIDFDFRYPIDHSTRQHNEQHIEESVKLYNRAIRKFADIPDDKPIRSFVFERDGPYYEKGNYKDGIHIMYPDVVLNVFVQHMIRKEVMKDFHKCCVENAQIGILPVKNSVDKIIDDAVISTANWMMYGCSKPTRDRYELTHIYDDIYDTINSDFVLKEQTDCQMSHLELINYLSIHKKNNVEREIQIREEFKPDILKFISSKTSKGNRDRQQEIRRTVRQKRKHNRHVNQEEHRKMVDEATNLTKILASYRANDYQNWIEVGWCLFNISPSLLDVWIDFSKQSFKYKVGECEDLWSTFEERDLGIGSLHRWAKIDSPDEYAKMRSEFIRTHIFNSLSGTSQDLANVLYQMFKHQFVCVDGKGKFWYEFKNHRWHACEGGITLKNKIGNEMLNEYLHLVVYYNTKSIHEQDNEREQSLNQAKLITDQTYKIRDIGNKEKIMKECIMRFYDPTFHVKLDDNPYLLVFDNGIYDLKEGIFRDGRPEDYVSFTTGIDYPMIECDYSDPLVIEIMEFFSQIFPDEELKEYGLTLFCSFLQGTNPDEKFHVLTGVGGNGKSKLIELFKMCFGDYFFTLPIQVLTGKRIEAGKANPDLAGAKGKRFGVLQEPSENDRLNYALMKELTGGDAITARQVYGLNFEYKPQFKLALCCNHKPKIPSDDEGTWRRMSVLDFKSRFVKEPNLNNKYEFPRDIHLSQKLERWKEMFMVILIDYYFKKYKNGGLVEPPMVQAAVNEYQKDSDIYAQFRDDCIVRDQNETLKLSESYAKFKSWYTDNVGGKAPTRHDYKKNIEKKLGVKFSRGWAGWKLFSAEDDMDIPEDQDMMPVNIKPAPAPSPAIKKTTIVKSPMSVKKKTLMPTPKKKLAITPQN